MPAAPAPDQNNDQQNRLMKLVGNQKAVVGIMGLGYVGLPLAASAALQGGFRVLGFDVDQNRVDVLNKGRSDIEAVPSKQLGELIEQDLFKATSDLARLKEADIILICVPTPLNANRAPDLSYVISTARAIGAELRPGQMVVLESTTYPGTTSHELQPLLEKLSGLKAGEDFYIAYSPEREDPGNARFTTTKIPKIIGADDEASATLAVAFYERFIDSTVLVHDAATAEAVKLTENIFRSVNIALVNELKVVYDTMGINVWNVIDAASTKPFGYMPFYPGPGIGGHCIPLDPFYLTWKAHEHGIHTRFIELAGEINSNMPAHIVSRIAQGLNTFGKSLSRSKILVMGVTYKKNVADVRESPALHIIEQLLQAKADVVYNDPYIASIPPTRKHPALTQMNSVELDDALLETIDCAVIITDHNDTPYEHLAQKLPLVIDTRNATRELQKKYKNIVLA